MRSELNQKGFTLIELLVVISIIGFLATTAVVLLNSARIKARDGKRIAEIKQLSTVLQLYFDDNNSYPATTGCLNGWCCLGHGDAGTCWNGEYHGNTALDSFLSPKYIGKIPDDPLNNTAKYGDAYMYRVGADTGGAYATLHWGIEKSNPTAQDCANGSVGNWGAGSGIGSDYYCMLIIR
ncbi:MAG: prepilin-type N-terminal cleavage/methylation domain-containing protein [bacterium]|nr:prepilin-type N-terminal cleavage/methylation domain-containing protein [bacterium]